MFRFLLAALLFALFFSSTNMAFAETYLLESPNKEFTIDIRTGSNDELSAGITFKGKKIVDLNDFGFVFDQAKPHNGIKLSDQKPKEVRSFWKQVVGEREIVPEEYNETTVEYVGLMKIIFRTYNEGIAFCYEFETKENEPINIRRERTAFAFEQDYPCWAVYSAQGIYENVPISKVKKGCERPLLIEVPNGPAISIGEARLVDFARMKFDRHPEKTTLLNTALASEVVIQGTGKPYRSPWRFVMAADHPGTLVEHNYMLKNLNAPCEIADTSWIKPGKVIREVTLTTAGGKACVDFAVERGLQYIEFDSGWYGHERDAKSDATTVTPVTRQNPASDSLDLQAVIDYAKSKGIGVLLYVGRQALEKQLDEILPLYKKWGVAGVKYGFVNVGSQRWTTWLHDAIKKAAEHELMVDVHDEYRSTGWERTYPNLLTVEGIGGNEIRPTTQHTVTLALTRTLCGIGDYTHCWYQPATYKGTRAHQLATAVVFYSPFQFLFWYDRPSNFKGEPELAFWKTIPTVWDETRVLNGEVGKYATFARRTGEEWYVGAISSGEKRTIKLPLDFLEKNKGYTITLYKDEPSDRMKVRIGTAYLNSNGVLDLDIAPDGGAALRIVPSGPMMLKR